MGGRVGLKGTDQVVEKAVAMHAEPVAPRRAMEFLARLKELGADHRIELVTCPSQMGEDEVRKAELRARILRMPRKERTTAEDTKLAIKLMTQLDVKIVAFVGGDGTAKDIFETMQGTEGILALGVPSGVKVYSGIFAASPRDAADVLCDFLDGSAEIVDLEVVDVDEEAFRHDHLSARLYGLLKGPFTPIRFLGSKQLSPETESEHESRMAIAKFIIEEMKPEATYILGPGTTIKSIADQLGVKKTVLGVDIFKNGKLIRDVNEKQIKREIKNWERAWIVLSPIGRQGMLLGRGNQQISPEVIRRVGKERMIVAATRSKLQGIEGGVLRVDTGDEEVDRMLKGYVKVATHYREWRLLEIV